MGEAMGKRQVELGALAVANIKRRGINFVGGVTGLKHSAKQWMKSLTGSRIPHGVANEAERKRLAMR
jgi:hypothetical protein